MNIPHKDNQTHQTLIHNEKKKEFLNEMNTYNNPE